MFEEGLDAKGTLFVPQMVDSRCSKSDGSVSDSSTHLSIEPASGDDDCDELLLDKFALGFGERGDGEWVSDAWQVDAVIQCPCLVTVQGGGLGNGGKCITFGGADLELGLHGTAGTDPGAESFMGSEV